MIFATLLRLFGFETLLRKRERLRRRFLPAAELLEDRRLLSTASPQLLRDINTPTLDSVPASFTEVNGLIYFTANDVHGREIWRTDGTSGGTIIVADIILGSSGSYPVSLANVNGTLFFGAQDATNGQELWRSDGTSAGTTLVKDINPGASFAFPRSLTNVNSTLFFAAVDATDGTELWRSDGSSAGTVLVKDINPGATGSLTSYYSLTNVNGTLFFSANDGTHSFQVWRSDGTSAGTTLVKNIFAVATPRYLTNANGTLFFRAIDGSASTELWRSDGTSAGTTIVRNINIPTTNLSLTPYSPTNVNGTLFLSAADSVNGVELWRSDGTCAGTTLVKDIVAGATGSSSPRYLTNVQGTLFFDAFDGANGNELWRSDGTSAGTTLVKQIGPTASSRPDSLTNVNGTLFFGGSDGASGFELWKSDGRSAGTTIVTNIFPGRAPGFIPTLTNANGTLFFNANDGTHGFEVWRSDGSSAGTTLVKDIYSAGNPSVPRYPTAVNGTLFFSAIDNFDGEELWRSTGTCAGTTLVNDIIPGLFFGAGANYLTNVNGTLFFTASDGVGPGSHGREVWRSNGTSSGTTLVKDINPSVGGVYPSTLANINGTLFLVADDGSHGRELWRSDGTCAGTTLVNDIFAGVGGSMVFGASFTNVAGTLFFVAADDNFTHGTELWRSDGTSAGTTLVKDIQPGGSGGKPYSLTNVNGTLFFDATDGTTGSELWRSNGTCAGTTLVKDILAGGSGSSPQTLVNAGGTLFFSATDGTHGSELWRSDGTSAGTTLVNDIFTAGGSGPRSLSNVNGTLFFTALDFTNLTEVWRSNGTSAGTTLVKDINPGFASSYARSLTNVNGTLFFSANDGTHGTELWQSDGTSAGTVLVSDLYSGTSSSFSASTFISSIANYSGTLFFVADDGVHGLEPFLLLSHPPTANNDSYTINEDMTLSVAASGVLTNDTDVDGDTLAAFVVDGPFSGTVTVNADGSFTYTPNPDFNGTDSFRYKPNDGLLDGNTATVTIVVNAVQDPPVANNDFYSVDENATLNVAAAGVLANDTDVDPGSGQPETLTTILINGASFGTLTLNDDGSFVYVGGPDFNGIDSFTYQVDDNAPGANLSGTATVVITVNAVNSPPVANNDSYSVNEDTTLSVAAAGVLGNDTDPDTDTGQPETLTAVLVAGASHGTVVLQGDGSFTYIGSQNFNGTDSFTYKVDDGGTGAHLSNTATVRIAINAVNDPPVANNDSYSVNEDTTLSVAVKGVLGNDTDVDPGTGQPQTLTAILVAGAGHGTVALQGNGAFTYFGSANFNGTDSFTYKANDGLANGNSATVTIVVNAVNDPPVANNDSYNVNEDTTLSVTVTGVLGNDTDIDPGTGQPQTLTALLVAGAAHGTVVLQGNGAFTYIGSQNFNGTDSFTYQANDGLANGNTATVTIRVNAVNDAPVANNDSYSVNENATLTIAAAGVLANDTDVDPGTGQPETLTALLVGTPTHGTLTLQSNGAFTYTASSNFIGTDSFTYKTNDGALDSNIATATIIVAVPVANNDSYSFFEDQTLTVAAAGVLGNDTDADGDTLIAQLVVGPVHGSLTLQSNGAFTYTPSADYNGSDSFTYRANDGPLNSNVATVILTIIPVNDAPVACDDLFSVFEDQSLAVGAPGVLGNDFDIDSPTLTALLVSAPLHGTLTFNADGSIAYVPAANYNGTDSFTYKANDGSLNSNVATVRVVVVSVNDPPVSGDDSYSVFEDATLSVAAPGVLNNDSDIDSPTLTPLLAGGPAHGTLTFNADGSFMYLPSANYNGTDSFTYRTNDGSLGSNLATVTIVVDPVNDAPLAGDDARSVFENGTLSVAAAGVLLNDSDIDSPTLTALLVTGPAHGTLTLNPDGSLTYVPNVNYSGTDSFTYKANDGLLNSNVATVTINVDPVNQAPTANNDAYSLFEDFTLTKTAPGVLANDTDIDSPVLTTNLVAGPAHGTLTFNTNGAFTYVPGLHYFGTDSFTYKANDGLLNSDIATVKITVIAVNHAPVANSNSYSVFEDSSLSVGTPGVLNNDSDIDGNSLTSILLAGPAHGTLTLRSNGAFTYTPTTHFSGGDSFTYRANDGSLNSTAATVSLNVIFVNHAPTANNDSYAVQQDTTLAVAVASGVLANDTDVENSALSAILTTAPGHGMLTLNSNGAFTYTPSSGFAGTDSFRYRTNDGSLNSGQATVTLVVQPPGPAAAPGGADSGPDAFVNHPPIANNDSFGVNEDTTLSLSVAAGVLANDADPDFDPTSIVTDGGFESGDFTGWQVSEDDEEFTTVAGGTAHDGSFHAALGTEGGDLEFISQTLTTQPGQLYTVDFWLRSDSTFSNEFQVSWDGTVLTDLVNLRPQPWTEYSFVVTAAEPSTVLQVGFQGDSEALNLDDVRVIQGQLQTLTALLVSGSTHGTVTLNTDGSFAYVGGANFNGTDSFTYEVDDGGTGTHRSNIATATITVNSVNDPPLANRDYYRLNNTETLAIGPPGVLDNDTDIDPGTGQPQTLTALLLGGSTHGTVTLNSDGSFNYVVNAGFDGTDSFTYQVDDGGTAAHVSNTATVTIIINAANDPPVACNDAFSVDDAATLTVGAAGVLANDTDADPGTGQPETLTALLIASSVHGTLTLVSNGSFVYVPSTGFNGTDSFTYQVDDGGIGAHLSNIATVTIVVDDAPVANNDLYITAEDSTLTATTAEVLANDTDADPALGTPQTVTAILVDAPVHGTLALGNDGSFTYVGSANFNGLDSFTYKANDGKRDSNIATVTLVVNPVNDAPQAGDDTFSMPVNATLAVPAAGVLAGASDVDTATGQPQTLTAILVSGTGHGMLTLSSDGSFTYVPDANFTGTDSFTYKTNDGSLDSDTATVAIVVANAVPLDSVNWAALGPAPLDNGSAGRIAALAAHPTDPNTIYIAAAGGGVWKTSNGGASWTPLTDGQSTLFMGAIALAPSDPNIIYAGTGEANNSGDSFYGQGVLKSTDGGSSWTLLGTSSFTRRSISRIVVDPTDANIVYVAVAGSGSNGLSGNKGIWKSTNGGTTWTNTTTSIATNVAFSDLAMDPTNRQVLYAAVGVTGGSLVNGVYKTTDGGGSWASAGNFPTGSTTEGRITLALAPTAPQTLYAAITDSGSKTLLKMMKTTDGGATWVQLTNTPNYLGTQGGYDTTLAVDPANANIVYAGGQAGTNAIIETSDGGNNWSPIGIGTDGNGPHVDHHGIGFDANGKLLDGNDGGIWRLDNPNVSNILWSDLNGNLNITEFVGIALHPTNSDIAYGGSQDNGTEKFNNALVWNKIGGSDGGFVRVDKTNPNTVYRETQNINLQRSDDGGTTFTTKHNGINTADPSNFYVPYVMDPANSSRLLYGTNRVYETTNRADNWAPISTPNTNGWASSANIDALAAAPTDVNTVYATAGGHIFVTTDHGASWQQRDVSGVTDEFHDILVDPTDSMTAYIVRDRFTGGHVFRTTDGGANWTSISGNLPDLPAWTIDMNPQGPGSADDVLYVGNDDGLYISKNLGASWVRLGAGLPHGQAKDVEVNTNLNILAVGVYGRGLWELSINNPPVANNDSYSVAEDTLLSKTVATGVLGNDTDVDQPETLTAILMNGAGHGTLTLQANGAFAYLGSQNFNGTDSFTYKVDDNAGGTHISNTATVTIVVNAVNDAPVANNDSYSVNEDTTLAVAAGVLANDTDVDPGTGQPETLTAILTSATGHGALTLSNIGSFTYVPSADFNSTDSFTYKVDDGGTGAHVSTTMTVTIVVNAVNDPPVVNSDSFSVFEDQTLSQPAAGVLANDTDVDPGTGQPETLTAILASATIHGNLTLHGDGSFTYLGNPDFNGTDSFSYVANDGALNSTTATVTITVIPVNDAPVACNDLYSVFEDLSLTVGAAGVLGNDFDIDSPTLTAVLVNPPLHGTLTLNADGSIAYVPAANYNGTDSFTYKANDGSLNSNLATVSVQVVSVNDPPVSGDDSYSVFEDATLSVAAPGVLNNDSDIDSPTLTPLLAGGPAHGTLTFNADGSFTYVPDANYNGTDSFTYRTNDGALGSNLATVTIVVDQVNDAPLAGDDARSVFENGTLSVASAGVLLNDSDIDSPTLTALLVTGPVHGTLTLNSDGSLTYIPNVNYSGTDSFTYKANDGLLNSNVATVTINVDPVNQAPTANNDAYSLFEDFTLTKAAPGVLANDTDVDSPSLTTNLVTGPAHGTLTFNTNGAFTYVPGLHYFGTDSFTYKANDGLLNSDVATVKITVIAVNHAPVANSNSYSVFEDSSLSVSTPGVLNNDSDIDGNPLTAILLAGPAHGTLTLRSNGAFNYTPAAHYSGADSFTYRANDGALNSTAATVTLNVLFVNHAPTANNDSYTVQEDTSLVVAATGVLANDTDIENSALTAILTASPAHGTLTLNANGSFTYTPSSAFAGTDSFRYRANDGSLNSTQATVNIVVDPGPQAASDDAGSAADISDIVSALTSALTDNHDGTFTGTITITNATAATDINGPLQVVLSLSPGVTLQNKTGDTPGGDPYITIPAGSLVDRKLVPGQSIEVTVVFNNPTLLSLSYLTKTLSGAF